MNEGSERIMKKRLFLFLAVVFLLFSGSTAVYAALSVDHPVTAENGEFIPNGSQWSYRMHDGTLARRCFLEINNKTYYFNSHSYRWYGWRTIKGKKYYFGTKAQGYLHKNTWLFYKGHYYYLGKDGTPKTGWVNTSAGKRYYFFPNGQAAAGEQKINGISYYFNSRGVLIRTGSSLNIHSECALLINADTGKTLYAKKHLIPHSNASTTKILTAILALENSRLSDKVKVSAYAASQEPTKLYMQEGQVFYMKDLLYSLLLGSHNDSAIAIAEHISGSGKSFVSLMNKKAKEIGCTNTLYATPHGLDKGLTHYTTARDLGKMARYALKNRYFKKIISTKTHRITSIYDKKSYQLTNSNELLGKVPGVIGMKTGFTSKAGNCFVGAVKSPKGNTYISVTLGAPTSDARWEDARTLLAYGYAR